uniref:RNA-directed DNA polymerase n=1 Tax=Drosophila melanogaster TaxID=7227 RepID=Q8T5U3_DROME|nr:pol protein [Drosophila melanogaster]
MLTWNIFETPIQQTNHLIHTSNGSVTINETTTIPPNNYFPIAQEFLIHKFSDHYDMLIGRKLLSKAKAIIDYQKKTATLFNKVYKIKDTEKLTDQNHAQVDSSFPQDPTFLETSTLQENLFRLNHLNAEEKYKLTNLLTRFKDIQFHEGDKLSFTNQEKHTINTTHNIPVYSKMYSFQQSYEQEVERQIQEMLEQGIIRESSSPYCSPIWVVPKKLDASGQQKLRIVIDYRKLNEITINDRYPMPNIDEILGKLGRSNYFTTIDLAKGFHQIEMDSESIAKTAFSTKYGHYEYTRMPFGLKNAPATFQRCMNNLLRPLLNKNCLVYLDDIIVFSTSLEEHLQSLEAVFEKLSQANLKLQLDKCEFLRQETTFLGHVITKDGIKPNPEKIKAIQDYPLPSKPKEIKAFLGITGYYRKFIPNFSDIAKPLTKCLKKGVKIDTKHKEYIEAFQKLKLLISEDPILKIPNFERKFVLTTDASNVALGAVLSQDGHPISYISRTLNEHEVNYSAIEKELLAIVWATKTFRHYLLGRHCEIASDHQPLCWLHKLKEPNSKLTRWKIRLSEYDFDIKYIKGKENHVADALSRIKIEQAFFGESTQHSAEEDNSDLIGLSEKAINYHKRQIIFSKGPNSSIEHETYFKKQIIHISYKEMTLEAAKQYLLNHFCSKNSALYIESDADFEMIQNAYTTTMNPKCTKIFRSLVLLKNIPTYASFKELILNTHEKLLHPGIQKTVKLFSENYYFPNSQLLIQNIINECQVCNLAKTEHRNTEMPMKITPKPEHCRDKFVIDIYSSEGNHYLSCIDIYSKFATLEQIKTKDWVECKNALMRIFNQLGKPKLLKADRDGDSPA